MRTGRDRGAEVDNGNAIKADGHPAVYLAAFEVE